MVTALVFDRLSPEARTLAVQAAQSYLGSKDEIDQYFGIFGVDLALAPYAPFTRKFACCGRRWSHVVARLSELQQPGTTTAEDQRRSAGGGGRATGSRGDSCRGAWRLGRRKRQR